MEADGGARERAARATTGSSTGEMKSYMWRFTADDGMDIVAILADVLAEFEGGCGRGQTGAGGHG